MHSKKLEKVLFFLLYVAIGPGTEPIKKKNNIWKRIKGILWKIWWNFFWAFIGDDAIQELLKEIDINVKMKEIEKNWWNKIYN